jgi:outer membrane protein OmpA-like peptidoglycan-associated protein
MPNFNTHWVVALKAIDSAPEYVQTGKKNFVEKAQLMRSTIYEKLEEIGRTRDKKAAKKFGGDVIEAAKEFRKQVARTGASGDKATCFSAYMLGACGPDFWTVPSKSNSGTIPDTAGIHFDLGHYNRTHQPFVVSVGKVGGNRTDLQALVERAYFCGLATHFAADLVIHQLVNVSAGAYGLLESLWAQERRGTRLWTGFNWTKSVFSEKARAEALKDWNKHNKVEHYWDSFLRYRYLGDSDPIWLDEGPPWWASHNFPVIEQLWRKAQSNPMKDILEQALSKDEVRFALEKPLMFPQLFADRMLEEKDLQPFLFTRVIDKTAGAYPKTDLFQAATQEVDESNNFIPPKDSKSTDNSELRKLQFFSSKLNDGGAGIETNNFLTYWICPDSQRLQANGRDLFYDLSALKRFVDSAAILAKQFVAALGTAYAKGDPAALGDLARFWNLDTGLGLRPVSRVSRTSRQVVTALELPHVFELPGMAEVPQADAAKYSEKGKMPAVMYPTSAPVNPFVTYPAEEEWPTLLDVAEDASVTGKGPSEKFLDEIAVKDGGKAPGVASTIADFLGAASSAARTAAANAPSKAEAQAQQGSQGGSSAGGGSADTQAALQKIRHRLDLRIDVPIPDFGYGKTGLFLFADKGAEVSPPEKEGTYKIGNSALGLPLEGRAHDWLANKVQVLYRTTSDDAGVTKDGKLVKFHARLLTNLEPDKRNDRGLPKGKWNNSVPWTRHEGHYGRNLGVGTARTHVLMPRKPAIESAKTTFDPRDQFAWYTDISPTECVYLSVYAIVKKDGAYHDAFSKEVVTASQIDELKKIDANGFVKVVFFYELSDTGGAGMVPECYIDGLKVPVTVVERPPAPAPDTPPPAQADAPPPAGVQVFFRQGSNGVLAGPRGRENTDKLKTLAAELNKAEHQKRTVTLTGFASMEGGKEANKTLSQERADAVKQLLMKFGVAGARITSATGEGELPGERDQARRVDVAVQ